MSFNTFPSDPVETPPRKGTPPPITYAIELHETSSLVRRIVDGLSAMPRRLPNSDNNTLPKASSQRRTANGRQSKARGASRSVSQRVPVTAPLMESRGHERSNSLSGYNMPPSPIDALASVAAVQAENNGFGSFENMERPSKRARSEALSPFANGTQYSPFGARPATSHISSMSWGRNVEQQIDSAVESQGEQLSAAETLLSLFHSNERSPDRARHMDGNGHSNGARTMPLASNVWTSPVSYAHAQSSGSNGLQFGPSLKDRIQSSTNGIDLSGQTHTPPDDGLSNGDYGKRNTLHEEKDIRMSNGHPPPSSNFEPKPQKQLQSPQSLPAELEDPKVKDHLEHNVKVEDLNSQGLGISHMGMAPPPQDSRLNPSSSQNHGIDDSQATISAIDDSQTSLVDEETKCAHCGFFANSLTGDTVDWMQCEGCQGWVHFACTGFTAKDIRNIDKFFCQDCRKIHGPTTFVRKSARNRTNVDYSSLNEGHYSTVDESHEHRYIQQFRDGTMKYVLPESFPRLAPEDITVEYFERLPNLSEPIVIPASLNPRPYNNQNTIHLDESGAPFSVSEDAEEAEIVHEVVEDDGQDSLDMVIPQGLTVRRVAELYGPHMPVPVIDVKSQEGDNKKWTVGEWASYYEQSGDKPVRNVISLEVSHSPLGKLLRRPKVVRDLDLQDSVWPESDKNRKAVKFYVLMSVADCYTDFHIDFGGSSVYYHILKGRKVFFFIPPTEYNLKKYEEWCLSPSQNETFLPDQTKECYRVDLYPGDTMLIPSGWIHSVWTPEDSLVVGGNYLTRLHLGMQIKITEIEKNTKVAATFRYPSFQKVQWYTILKYLEQDPVPQVVELELLEGKIFPRLQPIWVESENFAEHALPGEENYHHRFYAKSESEGWPALLQFIFRTVLIHLDRLDGITQETRKKVMASIPKGSGEPLDIARKFAIWVAWKQGNESVVDWAFSDVELPTRLAEKKHHHVKNGISAIDIPAPQESRKSDRKSITSANGEPRTSHRLGPKKVVCDSCREKKIACKHVDPLILAELASSSTLTSSPAIVGDSNGAPSVSISNGNSSTHVSTPKPKERDSTGSRPNLSADGKRRWGKACVDCRRSKRRCIHDENGKIDPTKQAQPSVTRTNKKRKSSTGTVNENGEREDELESKKLKLEQGEELEMSMSMIDPAILAMGALDELSTSTFGHMDTNPDQYVTESVEFQLADSTPPRDDIAMYDEEETPSRGPLANEESAKASSRQSSRIPTTPAVAVAIPQFELPSASRHKSGESGFGFSKSPELTFDITRRKSSTKSTSPKMGTSVSGSASKRNKKSTSKSISPVLTSKSPTVRQSEKISSKETSPDNEEEANLKLIMQLQAEQFGLRRRGT